MENEYSGNGLGFCRKNNLRMNDRLNVLAGMAGRRCEALAFSRVM